MLLKTTRTAVLTVAALDLLFSQPDCCPQCCGMCWILQDMVTQGDIDSVVHRAPVQMYEDSSWYDQKRRRVNTMLLTAKWAIRCDHGTEEDEAPAEEVDVE